MTADERQYMCSKGQL